MRLADVLEHCGVRNAVQAGRHVCFRGPKHELPQGAPLAHAGTRRCDACGQLQVRFLGGLCQGYQLKLKSAWHPPQQAYSAGIQ